MHASVPSTGYPDGLRGVKRIQVPTVKDFHLQHTPWHQRDAEECHTRRCGRSCTDGHAIFSISPGAHDAELQKIVSSQHHSGSSQRTALVKSALLVPSHTATSELWAPRVQRLTVTVMTTFVGLTNATLGTQKSTKVECYLQQPPKEGADMDKGASTCHAARRRGGEGAAITQKHLGVFSGFLLSIVLHD